MITDFTVVFFILGVIVIVLFLRYWWYVEYFLTSGYGWSAIRMFTFCKFGRHRDAIAFWETKEDGSEELVEFPGICRDCGYVDDYSDIFGEDFFNLPDPE